MLATIKSLIEKDIPGATVHVLDPHRDGVHLQALVISDRFDGMSRVKQHRLVMTPLKASFDDASVHALALRTFTPGQWETEQGQFDLT